MIDCAENDLLIEGSPSKGINVPAWLIVHHTGGTDLNPMADTSNQSFEIVDNYHKERWNGSTKSSLGHYIGYHYFIDKKGKVTKGRADSDIGAHTIGENQQSLGICMAGNFDATYPSGEQIQALTALLNDKVSQFSIPREKIVPHRHFATKTCYGNHLSDAWANLLIGIVVKEQVQTIDVTIPEAKVLVTEDRKKSIFEVILEFIIKLFYK